VEGRDRGLIKVLSWNVTGGTERNNNKVQDSRSAGRDLNPCPEYEAYMLTTLPQRSVSKMQPFRQWLRWFSDIVNTSTKQIKGVFRPKSKHEF
jgi:hypothetical protein